MMKHFPVSGLIVTVVFYSVFYWLNAVLAGILALMPVANGCVALLY